MNINIERLLFYEREYLRSFDWTAEQTYHIEMRRRLNLALHLWGIVDGLEILQGVLTPGAPAQFYISPGMAIDAYGREIFLFAPYPFSDDDFLANRITTPATYKVWIAYTREPSRPPAPGYRLCDVPDQYTRWRESYRIIISNDPGPTTPPTFTDALSDDPDRDRWQVRLGSIDINNVGGQLAITAAVSEQRTYIGLRAQRIVTPTVTPHPTTPPVDPVLDNITALDAPLSLAVVPDVFAQKNLVIGDNFRVDKTKIKPAPAPVAPAIFPSPTGNLKVASDLFLQGTLYANVAGDWLGLGEYLKSFIPEIKLGTKTIIPAPNADPSVGSDIIIVPTTLPKVTNASMFVALSGVQWVSRTQFNTWTTGIDQNAAIKLNLSVVGPPSVVGKDYSFTVQWEIGPRAPLQGAQPPMLSVQSITATYITLFYP